MPHATYPFEARADLPGIAFAVMRQVILHQAKTSDLPVLEDSDQTLTVETAHGLIGLRPGYAAETAGYVAGKDEHWLFIMKNAVAMQMSQLMPDVAKAMRWSNGPAEGTLPPNFAFVQVKSVEEIGPAFLRVTFQGEDLSKHRDDAIHFRLVIPPLGVAPEWPGMAANGSVIWPQGESAPHKPVYTTRCIDHATNTLIMDVFVHEGGRVTEWARGHLGKPGARRVVGIVGPSGGGLLHADRALMATDETGFPAAARILENMAPDTECELLLEAENGPDRAYPIDIPDGVKVTWLSRSNGDNLGDATLAALARHQGSKIWFAGERGQARAVRERAKAQGREADDLRISGFWTRG